MTDGHCFISYSHADGLNFVTKLADELESGHPFTKVWFEKREMVAGREDWDDQLANAIRNCKCLLYVMSPDSTAPNSNCKDEWAWALKYKKPVIRLWIDNKAEDQFRLNNRQKIDFTTNFDAGLAKLRKAISHLDSPAGELDELKRRLADAKYDLHRSKEENKPRIQNEIDELSDKIEQWGEVIKNPKAAENSRINKDESRNLSNLFDIAKKQTIFICYRRSDSADISGRIYDRLSGAFGKESIFKDVDSIPLGRDYREVLQKFISQCDIFLVVIGKYWLKTEHGEQRLSIPNDFVRFEIETALKRHIPVIPLTVNEARIPSESDLPENLHALIYRNGMSIRSDPDFHPDMDKLIRKINSKTD